MKRVKALLVGGAIATTTLLGMPGHAWAIPAFPNANNSCDAGDFCVWKDVNGAGGMGDTNIAVTNYNWVGFWGFVFGADNASSSFKNRWVNSSVSMYQNINYNAGNPGWIGCRPAGDNILFNFAGAWNDSLSSHKNSTGTGLC